MSGFGDYLSGQLEGMLSKHGVVVFYDPRSEFTAFFDLEVKEVGGAGEGLTNVLLGEQITVLARSEGSMFAVKLSVEPVVAGDEPGPLVVYLPGAKRDRHSSVLLELEEGGCVYEPSLKRLGRVALQAFYTDGEIDAMLEPETLGYTDVVGYVEQAAGGERASILKTILGSGSSEHLVVAWLADDGRDAELAEKQAEAELYLLLEARLGLSLLPETSMKEARTKLARFLLVNEFRDDLGEEPESLGLVTKPAAQAEAGRAREVIDSLRRQHPEAYAGLADQVESELNLAELGIKAGALGTKDTFRFEERYQLARTVELVTEKSYDEALEITTGRAGSFWVDRDVARQAQWRACELAAALGREITRIGAAMNGVDAKVPAAWAAAYADEAGWFEADRLQRQLETLLVQMDDEPEAEQAVAVVRHEHEELMRRMASGFSAALEAAEWSVAEVLHQTEIYAKRVDQGGAKTAYFLVDAMRYEMGVELSGRVADMDEVRVEPAIAALPTITPVGMAALLPEAGASFSVIEAKGKLAAQIDGSQLPDLAARREFLQARVPGLVDFSLADLLKLPGAELAQIVSDAPLVVVRSQEIDLAGEAGNDFARHVMDTVIGNLARAVRKLADAGIEAFVLAADHGHQYAQRKGEEMRTDAPKGDTVDLHRRCWAGRGGETPTGTVRVDGSELGYETDLSFVFPTGLGVFKAGGGLSYHHGGLSLQEMVIPVVSFRAQRDAQLAPGSHTVDLIQVPDAVTNRIFSVDLVAMGDVLTTEPLRIRILLLAGEEQVGDARMAVGASLDPETGIVELEAGSKANVGMMLSSENTDGLRIVVQDASSDVVLASSDQISVRLAI